MNGRDYVAEAPVTIRDSAAMRGVREVRVFAALKYEGAVSQAVPFTAASEDSFFIKAVTGKVSVAFAYTAVVSVVAAVVRELNQTAQIDRITVNFSADAVSLCEKRLVRGPAQKLQLVQV